MRHAALIQTTLFLCVIAITGIAAGAGALSFSRPADADFVTGRFAKKFETHYDETFPAKRFGVNLWAAIGLVVFGEGRPGIVLGNDHWLYTSEEFNVPDGGENNLRNNLALIAWVRNQLAARKVPLLVAVVPAKTRVYPEYIGPRKPAALQMELHDRLIAALAGQGIPTADLLDTLTAAKAEQLTFFRTDTHWTPFGAQRSADLIAALANERGLARAAPERTRFVTTLQPEKPHRGDLFSYLPLDPYFSALLPAPDRIRVPETAPAGAAPAGGDGDGTLDLYGDSATPQVALIGSSYSANPSWNFGGALKEALSEDLANLSKEGVGPFPPMVQYLLGEELKQAPPRLVIWEIPERALIVKPDLNAFALPPEALASAQR